MQIERDTEILEQLNEFNQVKHFGINSGISNLDKIVRFDKKRFNIITSNENQGKTTFTNYYCYMMAQTHNFKTLFLSFENDKMLFYSKLQRVYQNNDFVRFSRYLDFEDFKTIDDMFAAFDFYLENWHYDILVIDPFESLQIYMMGNYKSEDYASVLEKIRQYTKSRNIITILSAHQKKLSNENDEPTIANIFGSVSFGNKADNIISVKQIKEGVTQVKALKIRHNILEGVKGRSAFFSFNPSNERFKEISEEQANDYTFEEFALQAQEKREMGNHTAIDPKTLENENKAYLMETKVSLYENFMYKNDISLNDALNLGANKYDKEITKARILKNNDHEKEYKEFKKTLPMFTACCTYRGKRAKENIVNYNGLCVIDIDHITDVQKAKEDIKKLPFVLYCAKSLSGKGLFCLVRLSGEMQDYKAQFEALREDFKNLGYEIDESCKDLGRLRIISRDTEPFVNYQAQVYNKKKVVIPSNHYQAPAQTKHNQYKDCVLELQNIMEDVTKNHLQLSKNHSDTLYISNVLSSICGEEGRKYLHIIRQQRGNYDPIKTDNLFDYSLEHNTTKYSMAALRRKYNQARETAFI